MRNDNCRGCDWALYCGHCGENYAGCCDDAEYARDESLARRENRQRDIFRMRKAGLTYEAIAKKYGVTAPSIRMCYVKFDKKMQTPFIDKKKMQTSFVDKLKLVASPDEKAWLSCNEECIRMNSDFERVYQRYATTKCICEVKQ